MYVLEVIKKRSDKEEGKDKKRARMKNEGSVGACGVILCSTMCVQYKCRTYSTQWRELVVLVQYIRVFYPPIRAYTTSMYYTI